MSDTKAPVCPGSLGKRLHRWGAVFPNGSTEAPLQHCPTEIAVMREDAELAQATVGKSSKWRMSRGNLCCGQPVLQV
eukprot:CAMPEP_0172938432 /NCGR_PEP_ID=MMETSP1075-20121228/223022_1 /TAXON_ID=2916 /ORGANISM="Ceratium fusus, Strain PA161109" /LENGTH=76 /DNA_ID=CAMNT_0013799813 /DNA_START=143 /DNA_END=373 /DNA_ORIENTATION=-